MEWLVVHGILIDFYTSMWKFWTLLVIFFGKMADFNNFEVDDVEVTSLTNVTSQQKL